jgi:hypothetical protein
MNERTLNLYWPRHEWPFEPSRPCRSLSLTPRSRRRCSHGVRSQRQPLRKQVIFALLMDGKQDAAATGRGD